MISICVEDRPGGLAAILRLLAGENIDVEYLYAFVSKQNNDEAYVIMRIEEDFKAMKILKEAGYTGLDIE